MRMPSLGRLNLLKLAIVPKWLTFSAIFHLLFVAMFVVGSFGHNIVMVMCDIEA